MLVKGVPVVYFIKDVIPDLAKSGLISSVKYNNGFGIINSFHS